MPRLHVILKLRAQATLPRVADGREIIGCAAAPARAGGNHEFGESIAMITSYADLHFENGGVGRLLNRSMNVLQIGRQPNGRGERDGSAANGRAGHEQSVRTGVAPRITDLDTAGIPDGVSVRRRSEVLLESGRAQGAELIGG